MFVSNVSFRAGVLNYKIALDMMEYIKHEREYVPWAVTLRSLAYIGTMLSSRSSYEFYQVIHDRKKQKQKKQIKWVKPEEYQLPHFGVICFWSNSVILLTGKLLNLVFFLPRKAIHCGEDEASGTSTRMGGLGTNDY